MRSPHRQTDPRLEANPERLPPGQVLTAKWPVLHYGRVPSYDPERWRLRIFGEVDREIVLAFDQVQALAAKEVVCDIHCVTTWSRLDNHFVGVPLAQIAELAGIRATVRFVEFHCHGGFTTSVPLEVAVAEDALLAYRHDGQPLSPEHGFPLRALLPRKYFWKSAKWVEGVEFRSQDELGFWERNGYNNSADPWREERYW
ncbi:MAG: sulfite oxidase-like oxidoreductase [Candidatus Dormibacteria bacterium]